jgi:hypothetical protein
VIQGERLTLMAKRLRGPAVPTLKLEHPSAGINLFGHAQKHGWTAAAAISSSTNLRSHFSALMKYGSRFVREMNAFKCFDECCGS